MSSWSWKAGLAGVALLAATAYAAAQMSGHPGMMPGHPGMMSGHPGMMGMQGGLSGQPTLPGQDAFGAIQEVVQILESDPTTDWSKVNIAALREHLIDMNEVTLHAAATERRARQRRRNHRDGRRPDPRGDQAHGPGACRRTRQDRLERQDRGSAKWRQAHRHDGRRQAGNQAQSARIHGNHGPGRTPSASPSDDRQGRVSHALTRWATLGARIAARAIEAA